MIFNQQTQILASLERDLRYYADYIEGLSREIIDAGLSKYPIFIAYTDVEPQMGKKVLAHKTLETTWSINVSILEEFVKLGIVLREKLQLFRSNFKDPETHFCVFWISGNSTGFVFMPFEVQIPHEDIENEEGN